MTTLNEDNTMAFLREKDLQLAAITVDLGGIPGNIFNFSQHAPEKTCCFKGYLVPTLNPTTFSVQESGDPTGKYECTKQKGRVKWQGQGLKRDFGRSFIGRGRR